MKAPDKIYVHEASAPELDVPIPYSVEYIRKGAIKEFIENYAIDAMEQYRSDSEDADFFLGKHTACVDIIDKIDKL